MEQEKLNNNEILNALTKLINGSIQNQQNLKDIPIITAYEKYIECAKVRVRKDTIIYYEQNFKKINNDFFIPNKIEMINQIDTNILDKMVNHFKLQGKINNTINKYIEIIKAIVKFSNEKEYTEQNKIYTYKKLKKNENEIIIISNKNIERIMQYLENLNKSNFTNIRNCLIIHLLNDTGVRLTECLNIKCKDFKIEQNTLTLHYTKTGHIRTTFISNKTIELYNKYIKLIKSEYLLVTKDNKRLSKTQVYSFIKQIKADLNITQSISPHKWRHTLATRLLENKINIESVRRILGHTTLEITKRYLHPNSEDIKKDILNVL